MSDFELKSKFPTLTRVPRTPLSYLDPSTPYSSILPGPEYPDTSILSGPEYSVLVYPTCIQVPRTPLSFLDPSTQYSSILPGPEYPVLLNPGITADSGWVATPLHIHKQRCMLKHRQVSCMVLWF